MFTHIIIIIIHIACVIFIKINYVVNIQNKKLLITVALHQYFIVTLLPMSMICNYEYVLPATFARVSFETYICFNTLSDFIL